jgi:DNA modification methylase
MLKTIHNIQISDSRAMDIPNECIDLTITSPPYPMIQMWDQLFGSFNPEINRALGSDGYIAFKLMHKELDKVWDEVYRVSKPGAFVCINIGDATRTLDNFRLYPNHSRISMYFTKLGFYALPIILWKKQTNAPNKFMGSGMLPSGAYVTLEHEYILIFRKGGKREFKSAEEKLHRRESAYFWEERNTWFSDTWDFKGASQGLKHKELRKRSAAYPLELAYRLINMYSLYSDTVLDPFVGTGTTTLAGILCGRNTIGIDIDTGFDTLIENQLSSYDPSQHLSERVDAHLHFVKKRTEEKGPLKYNNIPHGFKVMTRQEKELQLKRVTTICQTTGSEYEAVYDDIGLL